MIPFEVLIWNRYQAVANFFHLAITAYCLGSVDTFPDWEEIEIFSHMSLLSFFSFANWSREDFRVSFAVDFPLLCFFLQMCPQIVCPRGIKVTLSDLWDFSPVSVFRSLLKYLQMHLHIIGYISKVFTQNGISNVSSKLCALEDLKSHCGICEVFISVSFQMFHQIFSSQIFLTFSVFLFCSTKQIFCVPSKPDQIIGATFDSEPQNMLYCQILCVPS